MKILVSALAFAALIFASSSCAKHNWEDTKVLHEGSHEGHGAHAADSHAPKAAEGAHAPAPAKH